MTHVPNGQSNHECTGGVPLSQGTMNSTPLQTPSSPHIDHSCTKGTPRKHKTPFHNRKHCIKKSKRSIQEIEAELKRILKLSLTRDEWQVHLIQRVQDGHDSIFTGYGKSIIFGGLPLWGTKKGENCDKPPEVSAERSGQSISKLTQGQYLLLTYRLLKLRLKA